MYIWLQTSIAGGEGEGEVTQSCPTLCNPMDCSLPGSSIHGILQQGYWSGLPFPSPGDLPDPGIESRSAALEADALTSEPPGEHPDWGFLMEVFLIWKQVYDLLSKEET